MSLLVNTVIYVVNMCIDLIIFCIYDNVMKTKMTPLSSPYVYQRFRGSCCLNIQVTVEALNFVIYSYLPSCTVTLVSIVKAMKTSKAVICNWCS